MQLPNGIQEAVIRAGTFLNDNKPAVKKALYFAGAVYPAAVIYSGNSSFASIMGIAKKSLLISFALHPALLNKLSEYAAYKLSPEQLSRFGIGQTFEQNPWALRHVVSLTAAAMAGVVVLDTAYRIVAAAGQAIVGSGSQGTTPNYISPINQLREKQPFVSDNMIRFLTTFAFFTSRPVLHVANQLFHKTFPAA